MKWELRDVLSLTASICVTYTNYYAGSYSLDIMLNRSLLMGIQTFSEISRNLNKCRILMGKKVYIWLLSLNGAVCLP